MRESIPEERSADAPSCQGAGHDPGVTEAEPGSSILTRAMLEALKGVDRQGRELDARIQELEQDHGTTAYTEAIHLLSHLRFEPLDAKHHWRRIVEHRAEMEARLGSPVDVRVALFSYFMQVDRKLVNPKIIELDLFQETCSTAYVDELTGLYNYRYLSEALAREVLRSDQYREPLSLIMGDVDHFKQYNDRQGHGAGNAILTTIGRVLQASVRRVDTAARFGGEEFVLLLPSTPKDGARRVAERARKAVERQAKVTISLGVATYPADANDAAELIRHADFALYAAKANGRNIVCLYEYSSRSYRRVEAVLSGRVVLPERQCVPLVTRCIGEGGMLFLTETSVPVGALVDVVLVLPVGGEIRGSGRILSVRQDPQGRFEIVQRLFDLPTPDRKRLADYLRTIAPEPASLPRRRQE